MDDLWLWLAVLLAGPVGSFLAVWAERSCDGRSLSAPSACTGCGRRLAARDLIPVVSFLLRRRRCRYCGTALPWRLLAAEVLAIAAALAAIVVTETWPGLALTLGYLWLDGRGPGNALVGGAIGAVTLLALRWGYQGLRGREGLGLGDVKLAAGIGAGLGVLALPWVGLLASLAGLAAAALGVFGRANRDTPLPFGVFLCAAAGLVLLWR